MKSQLSDHHLFLKTNARKEEHFYKIVVIKFRNQLVEKREPQNLCAASFCCPQQFSQGD